MARKTALIRYMLIAIHLSVSEVQVWNIVFIFNDKLRFALNYSDIC